MSLAATSPLQCNEKSSDHIVSPQLNYLSCNLRGFFLLMGPKWCTPFVIQEELHVVKLPFGVISTTYPSLNNVIFSSRYGLMESNCVWSETILHIFWCPNFLPPFKPVLLWFNGQTECVIFAFPVFSHLGASQLHTAADVLGSLWCFPAYCN